MPKETYDMAKETYDMPKETYDMAKETYNQAYLCGQEEHRSGLHNNMDHRTTHKHGRIQNHRNCMNVAGNQLICEKFSNVSVRVSFLDKIAIKSTFENFYQCDSSSTSGPLCPPLPTLATAAPAARGARVTQ
jgi:hypothetical protein